MHYVSYVVPSGQTPRVFQPLGISSHCESVSVVGFAPGTLVFSIKIVTLQVQKVLCIQKIVLV